MQINLNSQNTSKGTIGLRKEFKKKSVFALFIFLFLISYGKANAKLGGFYIGAIGGIQSMSPKFVEINGAKNVSGYDNYIGLRKSDGGFWGGKVGYLHQFPISSIFSLVVGVEGNFYANKKQSVYTDGASMSNLCSIGVLSGCTTATEAVMGVNFTNKRDLLAKIGIGLTDRGFLYAAIGQNSANLSFTSRLVDGSGNFYNYEINNKTSHGLYLGAGINASVSERVKIGVEYFFVKHDYNFKTNQAYLASGISTGESDIKIEIKNSGAKIYMDFILF